MDQGKNENKEKEQVKIERFTIDNVLTTAEIKSMSKKDMRRHIEYLEQVALGLDNGLNMAVDQINMKIRARDGNLT